jgi:hypothetical protein
MKRYSREAILQDKRFSQYQSDFLKVLLHKPYYSLAEAKKIAEAFFNTKKE